MVAVMLCPLMHALAELPFFQAGPNVTVVVSAHGAVASKEKSVEVGHAATSAKAVHHADPADEFQHVPLH